MAAKIVSPKPLRAFQRNGHNCATDVGAIAVDLIIAKGAHGHTAADGYSYCGRRLSRRLARSSSRSRHLGRRLRIVDGIRRYRLLHGRGANSVVDDANRLRDVDRTVAAASIMLISPSVATILLLLCTYGWVRRVAPASVFGTVIGHLSARRGWRYLSGSDPSRVPIHYFCQHPTLPDQDPAVFCYLWLAMVQPKVQSFLSWFGRKRLLPNMIASRPTRLDFVGNGRDCAVPAGLIRGHRPF